MQIKFDKARFLKALYFFGLAALILTLLIVLIIKFDTWIGFFIIYPWILSKILGTGINKHIAEIIALIAATGTVWGVYHSIYKRNSKLGYIAFVVLFILQSIFMFVVEKNRFFSVNGEVMKYYTINPTSGEIQMFDTAIYDEFGQKAMPVNYQISLEAWRQNNKTKIPQEEVKLEEIKKFFDVRTGKALVYYYEDDSGMHLFMHDGYDIVSGRKLLSVTSEVIDKCRQAIQKSQDEVEKVRAELAQTSKQEVEKTKEELNAAHQLEMTNLRKEYEQKLSEAEKRNKEIIRAHQVEKDELKKKICALKGVINLPDVVTNDILEVHSIPGMRLQVSKPLPSCKQTCTTGLKVLVREDGSPIALMQVQEVTIIEPGHLIEPTGTVNPVIKYKVQILKGKYEAYHHFMDLNSYFI